VSVLGVEEQRVNVVLDFVDAAPKRLGDGYRVDVRIVTWQGEQVLQVPASSVFRAGPGEGWAVFTVEGNGKARRREIRIGQRNAVAVQITGGIEEGAAVILHPPNELKDGTPVEITRKQPSSRPQLPPSL
jgi:HlyD family secretion protein